MRKPLVAGNWKMNGSPEMARGICRDLVAGAETLENVDIVLCPPTTLLAQVSEAVAGSAIATGSQDIDEHEAGAYTGQVSAAMVVDAGGKFAIIGHSERRTLFGETDERIAAKVSAAAQGGLVPILCVGETREEREQQQTDSVVLGQLDAVLDRCGVDVFNTGLIAYEPVWAIGTGLTATPDEAQAVHALIRARLASHDDGTAGRCRILYGGSMKPQNAAELIQQPDIDGGLIGGASLNSNDFMAICQAASESAAASG